MTVAEVAALAGTKPVTVRKMISLGRIKAEKHGRDWWIKPSDARAYAARSKSRRRASA